MPYILLLCYAAAWVLLSRQLPVLRTPAGFALALVMAVFAGLRAWSVDYDEYMLLLGYMELAQDVELPWRWFVGKDPLYGALLWIVAEYQLHHQWLFIISAVLSITLKWLAFRLLLGRSAEALLASLLLYFFLHEFTQMRVGIALGWSFWGMAALLRGQRLRWFVLMLLAAGFHGSALLLIPFMLLLSNQGEKAGKLSMAATVSIAVLLPLVLGTLGSLDARAETHTEVTGVGWIPQAIALLRFALFFQLYRWNSTSPDPTTRRISRMAFGLCAVGLLQLFLMQNVSSAWAFRTYELFDAFAIPLTALVLVEGKWPQRALALIPGLLSLAMYAHAGLLPPYSPALP